MPDRTDTTPPRMSVVCSRRYSLMWVVASAACARCAAEMTVELKWSRVKPFSLSMYDGSSSTISFASRAITAAIPATNRRRNRNSAASSSPVALPRRHPRFSWSQYTAGSSASARRPAVTR
jgi:hypothetical protein